MHPFIELVSLFFQLLVLAAVLSVTGIYTARVLHWVADRRLEARNRHLRMAAAARQLRKSQHSANGHGSAPTPYRG